MITTMSKQAAIKVTGHVVITDAVTKEVLVDQHNDVNMENTSEAIALALSRFDHGYIEEMSFGNGGTVMGLTGELDYNPPNVTGINADLYNPTYAKVVNNNSPYFTGNPANTNITIEHITGALYTDIKIVCLLDVNEPSDAAPYDDIQEPIGGGINTGFRRFVFDEMGLKTVDYNTGTKRLLTHIIFHPIQKSLNRAIEFNYTIRIQMIQP